MTRPSDAGLIAAIAVRTAALARPDSGKAIGSGNPALAGTGQAGRLLINTGSTSSEVMISGSVDSFTGSRCPSQIAFTR